MKKAGLSRKLNKFFILFFIICLLFSAGVALASGDGAAKKPLISVIPDVSLFMQIGNFIFLILALNVVLYKPIRKILLQRKEKISGFEQGIESAEVGASEKEEAFNSGIKDARAKGLLEKEVLLNAAAEEEGAILQKINERAQADLAEVKEKVAKDTESVMASLLQEVDTFADAISQKILGRAV